jgi:hypothetical protein
MGGCTEYIIGTMSTCRDIFVNASTFEKLNFPTSFKGYFDPRRLLTGHGVGVGVT